MMKAGATEAKRKFDSRNKAAARPPKERRFIRRLPDRLNTGGLESAAP